MKRRINLLKQSVLACALAVPFALFAIGCQDGSAEEAGENIDEAAEDVGEAAEDAAEGIEDAAEDATD
ncbi:MAG: hypothetical protein RLY93_06920 [Sumerlaeia bacterium]